jgi:hypothetical protein
MILDKEMAHQREGGISNSQEFSLPERQPFSKYKEPRNPWIEPELRKNEAIYCRKSSRKERFRPSIHPNLAAAWHQLNQTLSKLVRRDALTSSPTCN